MTVWSLHDIFSIFETILIRRFKFYLLLLLLGIYSCSKKTDYHIVKKQSYTIKLNLPKDSYINKVIVFNDDTAYWASACRDCLKIELYNLHTSTLYATIDYSKINNYLPNSYSLQDMGIEIFLNNLDSIIIIPRKTKQVFILNRNGDIIKHIELTDTMKFDNQNFVNYSLYHPVKINDGLISVNAVPAVSVRTFLDRNKYYSFFPIKYLNIKEARPKLEDTYLYWPKEYFDTAFNFRDFHPHFSYSYTLNKLIVSFNCNEKIYLYDFNSHLSDSFYTKSSYFSNFISFIDDSIGNFDYTRKFFEKRPFYGPLYFNDSLKIFYRVFKHFDSQKWSLMIFDETMKSKHEIMFDTIQNYLPIVYMNNNSMLLVKNNTQQPYLIKVDEYLLIQK